MSRIGKQPVVIPAGVTVTVDNSTVNVKGVKGELTRTFSGLVEIKHGLHAGCRTARIG